MNRTIWLSLFLVALTIPLCAQSTSSDCTEVNLTGGTLQLTGPGSQLYGVSVTSLLTAPKYTITNVSGNDPANTGIASLCNDGTRGCTPSQISSFITSNFGIVAFPPSGSMRVNGQLFGMWGFPGFVATTFNSRLGEKGVLTVYGDAAGYGFFNECDLSGNCMPIPNGVCFLFGKTQWQYFGQFVPDTDPGSQGTYDFSYMFINITSKSATETTLVSSLDPSIYGQKVSWTATVTPGINQNGVTFPVTGKVNFKWGSYSIGAATLNANGVATLTRSDLNADPYPLTAVYSGDLNNAPSTSPVLDQVVTQTTNSATLTSSLNPSTLGQNVNFVATITSPTVVASGPVTFFAGTTVLGTAQLSGGKAKFTISTLAVGSTTVTATYYGDSNIAKSSASVIQTVHQ